MPGLVYQLFDIQRIVAKGSAGFGLVAGKGLVQLVGTEYRTHATATATGQGLEHDRAMFGEKAMGFLQADRPIDPGYQRYGAALGQLARRGLVAKQLQHLAAGADK